MPLSGLLWLSQCFFAKNYWVLNSLLNLDSLRTPGEPLLFSTMLSCQCTAPCYLSFEEYYVLKTHFNRISCAQTFYDSIWLWLEFVDFRMSEVNFFSLFIFLTFYLYCWFISAFHLPNAASLIFYKIPAMKLNSCLEWRMQDNQCLPLSLQVSFRLENEEQLSKKGVFFWTIGNRTDFSRTHTGF